MIPRKVHHLGVFISFLTNLLQTVAVTSSSFPKARILEKSQVLKSQKGFFVSKHGLWWSACIALKYISYLPQNLETLVIAAEAAGVVTFVLSSVFAMGI